MTLIKALFVFNLLANFSTSYISEGPLDILNRFAEEKLKGKSTEKENLLMRMNKTGSGFC